MNRLPWLMLALAACAPTPPSATPVTPVTPVIAAPAPQATSDPLTPGEQAAAARLTASSIDAPLRYLSDDLLEGRSPGTRGSDLAIRYIAAEMEATGLRPGATDGAAPSWFQKVPLVGFRSHLPATETFASKTAPSSTLSLAIGTDVIVGTGVQQPKVSLDVQDIVFVGYGIVAPEYQWDDYKNVDVKGKIVLVMNDDPSSDPNLFEGKTRLWYGRWVYKYLEAARHGAAAAIIIHTTPSAGYPWQVVVSSWSASSEHFDLPADPGDARVAAQMWGTEDACRKIARLGGKDLDALRAAAEKREFVPVPLGVRTSLSFTNELRTIESANVVGMLPGSDSSLANEAVVYTAHHDHLGNHSPVAPVAAKSPAKGTAPVDTIYNGAIDNASGVATLLAIARASALSEPTKRTRLFIAVTAEEQGLLGSAWYAKHPTFPAGRIAADLNIDSANMNGRTSDVSFVGYGRSSVDRVVTDVARAQGRTVHGDAEPEKGAAYRSDQFSFARIGVPFVYLRGGPSFIGRPEGWGQQRMDEYIAARYHQPSDEYSKDWDYAGAVEDAQLLLLAGMRIANDPALPSWNPGNEFEAARKAALAAAH